MNIAPLHHWLKNYQDAIELQKTLADSVILRNLPVSAVTTVAGVDVTAVRGNDRLWAAVVVLTFDTMEIIERQYAMIRSPFPYIPGLLSFRELPVVIEAMKKLQTVPDVIICDGQGLAHPRFLGLASHLGLWLRLPTIGCAKSRLVGEAEEPGLQRGDYNPLRYHDRVIGSVLRTRTGVKPVFVSPGHLTDLSSARDIVLACGRGRRLPEPTRLAHHEVNAYRRQHS